MAKKKRKRKMSKKYPHGYWIDAMDRRHAKIPGAKFYIVGRKPKPKKSRKKGLPAGLKKWNAHLSKVRKDNPGLSLKQAMKKASKSY